MIHRDHPSDTSLDNFTALHDHTAQLPELVRGVAALEPGTHGLTPHRLPARVRERDADAQLLMVEAQPSGVRIALTTAATQLELITHPKRVSYRGVDRPRGRIDVTVNGVLALSEALTGGDETIVDLQSGAAEQRAGDPHRTSVTLAAGANLATDTHTVEFWLPHNEALELVALRADAPVAQAAPAGLRWLHHGSSISQGSNALTPTQIWPVVAAREAGAELTNLGFGGSAVVDQFVARMMRDAEADVISLKFGINIVNIDGMRLRTFVSALNGFIDTVRDGHPDTPLLLVSPLFCGIHEDTPGPGAIDPASFATGQARFLASGTAGDTAGGRLTLRVIREAQRELMQRRADDPQLFFLDGLELYSEADAELFPLPDTLHPSAEAHALIGARFAEHAFGATGPFAR